MGSELNFTHTNVTLGHNRSCETTSSILDSSQKTNYLLESVSKGLEDRAESILSHEDCIHLKTLHLYKI